MFNSTVHRDQVISRRQASGKNGAQLHEAVKRAAAEQIQRFWRQWYAYCQENQEWMTTTWICATMIQAAWRSYHVRRLKLDRMATLIQRHVRRMLVQRTLLKHRAAVAIQRVVIGMLTRMMLLKLQEAANAMQRLNRGHQGRLRYLE